MTQIRTLLAAGVAVAFALSGPVYAHDSGGPGTAYGQMAPGTMGQGHMGYGQMGPGMMGQRHMGCGQMSPGMMGQRHLGYGQMSPGMMPPLRKDLSAADVKHMLEHRLAWNGNPHIAVGKVEEKDADTIVAKIVTKDGSLVESLKVDRHTGAMQPVR